MQQTAVTIPPWRGWGRNRAAICESIWQLDWLTSGAHKNDDDYEQTGHCADSATEAAQWRHQHTRLSAIIVVWPTMSCFADWSIRRHVTLSIIICSPLHGHPGWHYNVTPGEVKWRWLNANVRYILRCFYLRSVCFLFLFWRLTVFIKYSLNLLISAILQ